MNKEETLLLIANMQKTAKFIKNKLSQKYHII